MVYFEQHSGSASFQTPPRSVEDLCEMCRLPLCYSSQIEKRIDLWQLSSVHLATKSKTNMVILFFFKTNQY